MKVTMIWAVSDETAMTLKVKLPRKWREGPTSNLTSTFVDAYNKKHPDAPLDLAEVHLVSPDGVALADANVVGRVLKSGAEVAVAAGPPPAELAPALDAPPPPEQPKAAPARKVVKAKSQTNVSTKEALLAAMDPPTRSFDYSKWDRLDLSDDDGDDCHPNIDKASWMRLKGRQREERREGEDSKIGKLKGKIEKHKFRAVELQSEPRCLPKFGLHTHATQKREHCAAILR